MCSPALTPLSGRAALRASDADHSTSNFCLGISQNQPLLLSNIQNPDISSRHKRQRVGQLDNFTKGLSWNSASSTDAHSKSNAAASFTSPCLRVSSSPSHIAQVSADTACLGDNQAGHLLPYEPASSSLKSMPVRRVRYSSDSSNRDPPKNAPVNTDNPSTRLSASSRPIKRLVGLSSRRRPVPGENTPRMVTTWRETTSSRGQDNRLSVGAQTKEVPASFFTSSSVPETASENSQLEHDLGLTPGNISSYAGHSSSQGGTFSEAHLPEFDTETYCDTGETFFSNAPSLAPWLDLSVASENEEHAMGQDLTVLYSQNFSTSLNLVDWPNNELISDPSGSFVSGLPATNHMAHFSDPFPDENTHLDFQAPLNARTKTLNSSSFVQPTDAEDLDWDLCDESVSHISALVNLDANTIDHASDPTPSASTVEFGCGFGVLEGLPLPGKVWQVNAGASINSSNAGQSDSNFNTLEDLCVPTRIDGNTNAIKNSTFGNFVHQAHFSDLGFLGFNPQSTQFGASTKTLPRVYNQNDRGRIQEPYMYMTEGRHPLTSFDYPLSSGGLEYDAQDPLSHMGIPLQTAIDSRFDNGMQATSDFEEFTSSTEGRYYILSETGGRTTTTSGSDEREESLQDCLISTHACSASHLSADHSIVKDLAGSHGPIITLTEDTNETQEEIQNILAKANQVSGPWKAKSSCAPSLRKTKTSWAHTFVVQSEFIDANESLHEPTSYRSAKRKGPLGDESKKRAHEMRKIGSCLRCRVSKIKCTSDKICVPCQKVTASPLMGIICARYHLRDFVDFFLPAPAIRPFLKNSIDQLMKEKISGFSNNQFEVYVTSGPTYRAIQVTIHTFHSSDYSFLAFKKLVRSDVGNVQPTFIKYYSPPLSIKDDTQDLRSKLKDHISDIIRGERNFGEVKSGSTSQLSWDVREAVRSYQLVNPKNQFLRSILMLHAMQYFMTKSITILRSSSEHVLDNLARPLQLNYSHNPNVRLINIQVKHEMCSLIRDTYLEVLENLEKALRLKELELWAPNFCCVLILCMCAEMVQTTTDLRIVNALDEKANLTSRDDGIDIYRKLEDLPIANITSMFHLVYRTNKLKDRLKREEGFNPIRDGIDPVKKANLGQDVKDLVTGVRRVMNNSKNELDDRASDPSFNTSSNILEEHAIFRKRNSGRLVAKFLVSLRNQHSD